MKLPAGVVRRLAQHFGELNHLDIPDPDAWGRVGTCPIVFFDFTDLGADERQELMVDYLADAFVDSGWIESEDEDDEDSELNWVAEDVVPIAVIGRHSGELDDVFPWLDNMDGILFLDTSGGDESIQLWSVDAAGDEMVEVASSLDELIGCLE